MSPIEGLTETRRLPRLGKIRLGTKVKNAQGVEYPKALDYFLVPPEVAAVSGEKPTELDIMIPVEDDEMWASQYYKRYSRTRGLVCKGDGKTCRRMVDVKTGETANRDTKEIVWKEGLPCMGQKCLSYQVKPQECKEVMHLQFIMPDVPGLGVWQIDTSSVNSIRNINSEAAMTRAVYGRLVFLPLRLTLEPTEVVNPDDGKKKTVRVMHLRVKSTMRELMTQAVKPARELLLPPPTEDEAPEDNAGEIVETVTTKPTPEQTAKAEKDIKDLWPDGGTEYDFRTGKSKADKPPEPALLPTAKKPDTIKPAVTTAPPVNGVPSTTEALMTWVCEAKAFRTVRTAREWLLNVCKIPAEAIEKDPAGVYQEVKQLLGK